MCCWRQITIVNTLHVFDIFLNRSKDCYMLGLLMMVKPMTGPLLCYGVKLWESRVYNHVQSTRLLPSVCVCVFFGHFSLKRQWLPLKIPSQMWTVLNVDSGTRLFACVHIIYGGVYILWKKNNDKKITI